jgi:peptidoglycan-N-acetylglucosamine deacetylase
MPTRLLGAHGRLALRPMNSEPSGVHPLKRRLKILGLAALFLIVLAVFLQRISTYSRWQIFGDLIYRVDTTQPIFALTFDDGPHPIFTPQILDLLAAHRAKATFFVLGMHAKKYPQILTRILAEGHELANHSFSHSRLVFRSPGFIRDEIGRTDTLLNKAGARGVPLFRAPYGAKLFVLPWLLAREKRSHILFDIITNDYERPGAEVIAADVLARVRPGSIVVMHDGGGDRSQTVAATKSILQKLQRRKFRALTVSELLRERKR